MSATVAKRYVCLQPSLSVVIVLLTLDGAPTSGPI